MRRPYRNAASLKIEDRAPNPSPIRHADLPADHPDACSTTGTRRAAPCCSPTTWKSAPAPSTPRPSCARSARSRGTRPTCSPRAAPRTAATARIPNRLQHYYQYQVVLKPSPRRHPRPVPRLAARRSASTSRSERHPLRRGRLGIADAGRLGPGLGSLAERHGSHAVHLLPAGRRPRLQAGLGRDHLRPRAPGDVPAGRENVYDLVWTDGRDGRRR